MLKFSCRVLWFVMMSAQASAFTAGTDYVTLPTPMTLVQAKPRVIEFFSYGCPACFAIESALQKWEKVHQSTVDFVRIPVVFHTPWATYAKAYYAAEALGLLPRAHEALFKAIHVQHRLLATDQDMVQFFVHDLGVAQHVAEHALLHSMSADLAIKAGMMQAGQYGVQQIPAFVIQDRYKTDLAMAKDKDRLMTILTSLAQQSHSQ